ACTRWALCLYARMRGAPWLGQRIDDTPARRRPTPDGPHTGDRSLRHVVCHPPGMVAFQVHIACRLVTCPLGAVRVTGPLAAAGPGPDRDDCVAPVAALGGRQALLGAVVAGRAA
ncbi:MAG: hypothetical protein M1522_07590, partial [Actinobacteria bacterium]|nr:hypothetical protein [Actinomycetota bacterium]